MCWLRQAIRTRPWTSSSNAQTAADDFSRYCHEARFERVDTEVGQWPYIDNLLHRVNCHDLVIVTQARPNSMGERSLRRLTEELLLHSARPVLVLPYTCTDVRRFGTVMLAWNDSRECACAAADAMPFLQRADRVHVVSWDKTGDTPLDAERRMRILALGRWLQRHGVTAELHHEPDAASVGEAMLSRAADLQADLIVMGGYGHPRMQERVFGGATRTLLDSMTVPVLMSH